MSERALSPAAGDNQLREPLAVLLDRAPPSWRDLIEDWRRSNDGRRLTEFVRTRQACGATIYPAQVLHALALTPREAVRVVILGQDPYHRPGQADGLAFSVAPGVAAPPSLRNILAELRRDLESDQEDRISLDDWASQGVLLLNTCLTVEDGRPASHAKQGWEALTDRIVESLSIDERPKSFMLWGAHAQAKASLIEAPGPGRHQVLRANHPSPLSALRPPRPFLGCGHFGSANRFLTASGSGLPPINWLLSGAKSGVRQGSL